MPTKRTIHAGTPHALRESNKRALLERLLAAPEGLTRPELARSLGLTVTAITNLVAGDGESLAPVIEESLSRPHRGHSGPTPKVLRLKPRLGYVIGIELSRTHVRLAFSDLFGNLDAEHDKSTRPWDVSEDLHGALAYVTQTIHSFADARRIEPAQIAGIGLSIPAPVDIITGPDRTDRRGRVRFNLGPGGSSSWSNIDPMAALTNHLAALPEGQLWSAIELHVDNDANLGALAELRLGAGRGRQNIIYVYIAENGIGAGLIFDGVNYHGAGGIAGELGHVVLDPDRTERCGYCGRPCLQAVFFAEFRRGQAAASDQARVEAIVRSALDGDESAIAAVRTAAGYLGRAIAPFVTVLNPERVLLSGSFPAQAYSLLIPPVQDAVARLAIAPAARDYVVELGVLHEYASLNGAVWLALERTRLDYLLGMAVQRVEAEPGDAARTRRPSSRPYTPGPPVSK